MIATSKTDNTSCDPAAPNGKASANVGGVTTGYTFTWYEGVGTSGTVVDNTATTLAHLKVMTYTVKVVNNATGCSSTAQVSIANNTVAPVVSASATPVTICSSPNGSVSANVGGTIAGYTFYWFDGNVSTPNIAAANYTGDTYANRTPNFYTVVAVDNITKCQSAKATVQVLDNTVLPVIATTKTDQTSCDPAAPNGKASATVGGVTTGYTFTWYEGVGTSGTVVDNTAVTAAHLKAMTYTVKVVNDATGCTSTAQVSIVNNTVTPVVSASATPVTFCSSPNGSVSANVGGNITSYTFYWFDGNVSTPNIAAANHVGDTYPNRTPNFYTVVAVDNITKCQSAKATVQVLDNTVLPVIATTKTDQTSCDPAAPNGKASASVGGVTTGYTFTWYEGVGTSGAVVDNTAVTAAHLKAMTYTVKVVNDATGCTSTAQVSIVNNTVTPVVSASATPVTSL